MTFDAAVENTKALIRACREAGVRRFVHLSVTSAAEDSPLPYFRGKRMVERAIRESGLSYAILRPALVYGEGDILVNNIAWFLRRSPVFVVMGDGAYRLQGVDVEELAEVAVNAGGSADSAVMDVVGPETYTFNDLVRLIATAIGSRAWVAHAPPGVVHMLLAIPGCAVHDFVLTRDEIKGLMANLLISGRAAIGRRRFRDWVAQHGETLGRRYASESDRHFRRCGQQTRLRSVGSTGALVLGNHTLVVVRHQRRRNDEVGGRAIAGDRDIPDGGDAQEGPHVGVVRMRLQRIPEKDQDIDAAFGDPGADLLIAPQRAALKLVDIGLKLLLQEVAGRLCRVQLMLKQEPFVEQRPLQQVGFLVVVGHERDSLSLLHCTISLWVVRLVPRHARALFGAGCPRDRQGSRRGGLLGRVR